MSREPWQLPPHAVSHCEYGESAEHGPKPNERTLRFLNLCTALEASSTQYLAFAPTCTQCMVQGTKPAHCHLLRQADDALEGNHLPVRGRREESCFLLRALAHQYDCPLTSSPSQNNSPPSNSTAIFQPSIPLLHHDRLRLHRQAKRFRGSLHFHPSLPRPPLASCIPRRARVCRGLASLNRPVAVDPHASQRYRLSVATLTVFPNCLPGGNGL